MVSSPLKGQNGFNYEDVLPVIQDEVRKSMPYTLQVFMIFYEAGIS